MHRSPNKIRQDFASRCGISQRPDRRLQAVSVSRLRRHTESDSNAKPLFGLAIFDIEMYTFL